MSWSSALSTILPPYNGVSSHITTAADGSPNDYYDRTGHAASRHGGVHGGVDINYFGGQQASANKSRPLAYSPVAGTVVGVGGPGRVSIKDSRGFTHDLLHMERIQVHQGQTVNAGDPVGHMSDVGAGGQIHVHYQIKNANGEKIDPVQFWNDPNAVTATDPIPPEPTDESGRTEPSGGVTPPSNPIARLLPNQAQEAVDSEADRALWTNRVPMHEPWPRVLKCQPQKDPDATQEYDNASGMTYDEERQQLNRHHTNEFSDGAAWVGRAEGTDLIERNKQWRR